VIRQTELFRQFGGERGVGVGLGPAHAMVEVGRVQLPAQLLTLREGL
jgi:hypothetical protein